MRDEEAFYSEYCWINTNIDVDFFIILNLFVYLKIYFKWLKIMFLFKIILFNFNLKIKISYN